MLGLLTFIIIFGIIVVVHEFGHFYFAKKSGILVREFAIGMGPKLFIIQIKKEPSTQLDCYLLGAMFAWQVGVMIRLKLKPELPLV